MTTQQVQSDGIIELIRGSTNGEGRLTFGGADSVWHPVDDFRSLPNDTALYAIGLKLGVQYERMISRIIYFGSTAKLRERMRSYATRGHNDRLDLLRRRFPGGLECSFHIIQCLDLEGRRAIEDAAMQEAFRSFGCFPVCNFTAIDSPHREALRGLVHIALCDGLPYPQSLASLNCGNGVLDYYPPPNGKQRRTAGSAAIDIVFSIAEGGESTELNEANGNATNTDCAEAHRRARELEDLSWLTQSNVVVWSQEKMDRIVAYCKHLNPIKLRGPTRVITFDAPTSAVPRPDTWGEVALLKARELIGTFYPQERVWLKVRFEKVLLGQAILESNFYRGEDKSDLPQTNSRESIDTDDAWHAEVAAIPAEVSSSIQPTEAEILNVPGTDSCDPVVIKHLRLLQSAQKYDKQEAATQRGFDQYMARERDRYSKARRILDDRIESRYQAAVNRNLAATGGPAN